MSLNISALQTQSINSSSKMGEIVLENVDLTFERPYKFGDMIEEKANIMFNGVIKFPSKPNQNLQILNALGKSESVTIKFSRAVAEILPHKKDPFYKLGEFVSLVTMDGQEILNPDSSAKPRSK